MRHILFTVSVMAAFGGMCTGLFESDLEAELVEPGDDAATGNIEAEPAEPALAIPVGGEATECCCELPDGDPRLEATARCEELGGECAEADEACEAGAQGSGEEDVAGEEQAGEAVRSGTRGGTVGPRPGDSLKPRDNTSRPAVTRPGTDGSRKTVSPPPSENRPKVRSSDGR